MTAYKARFKNPDVAHRAAKALKGHYLSANQPEIASSVKCHNTFVTLPNSRARSLLESIVGGFCDSAAKKRYKVTEE